METGVTRGLRLLVLSLSLALSACYGTGISEMNTHSFWNNYTPEDKQDATWWDRYYGRKGLPTESSAWKDYYKAPNATDVAKPNYCGYWGNCPNSEAAATSACAFYGNCPKQ